MLSNNKRKKTEFEQFSIKYLESVKKRESDTYAEGEDQVWGDIEKQIQQRKLLKIRKALIYSISAAACFLLLIGGTLLLFNSKNTSPIEERSKIVQQQEEKSTSNEIRLLTAGNETVLIDDEEDLKYDKDGNVRIGSESLNADEKTKNALNQLIVPKGKRINLYFSDGTRMFVNSDTKVTFPAVFDEKERKIFVDGEVYLDVKKDENCPFLVKTDKFTVHVKGTSFNVNSYSKEEESTIVLVTGKVEVESEGEKRATLSPNEMFRMKGAETETKKVNVSEYICWTQNIMMFKNEPLDKALARLSKYYGLEIIQEDQFTNIPLNGKIDLRDSLKDVLAIIEAAVPVKFASSDGLTYTVKRNR